MSDWRAAGTIERFPEDEPVGLTGPPDVECDRQVDPETAAKSALVFQHAVGTDEFKAFEQDLIAVHGPVLSVDERDCDAVASRP